MVKIKVLFFASAREAAGNVNSVEISLQPTHEEESDSTIDTSYLRKHLAEKYPKLGPLVLNEENITLALNEEYIDYGDVKVLKDGDVIALIPPISGG